MNETELKTAMEVETNEECRCCELCKEDRPVSWFDDCDIRYCNDEAVCCDCAERLIEAEEDMKDKDSIYYDRLFAITGTSSKCGDCGKLRPLSEFVYNLPQSEVLFFEDGPTLVIGYRSTCKACAQKAWDKDEAALHEKYDVPTDRTLAEIGIPTIRCCDPKNITVFENGMVDLTSGTRLFPLDPNFFTLNVVPYNFDPDARSQLFETTVSDIFNGDADSIRLLYQWLGYNIIPDISQEKLMLFIGDRRAGKSMMIDILRGILGAGQCCSTSYRALARPFGCSALEGKLAATIGDVKIPSKNEANAALEVILKVVGGDTVPIEHKFRSQYDKQLVCRFTIGMNSLPAFSDSARAFTARSNILYFPNSYYGKEDFSLKARLVKEAKEGKLISYAIQGLKDLRQQGCFTVPETSKAQEQELEEITAPAVVFARECCELKEESYATKDMLFEAWINWCKLANRKIGNVSYFCRFLKQACPTIKEFKPRINGKQTRAFKGIELQDWVCDEWVGRPRSD